MNSHHTTNTTLLRNKRIDKLFEYFGIACTFIGLAVLVVLIGKIAVEGLPRIDWQFLTSLPSRFPEKAGILTAWTGTVWIFVLTASIAIPLGVAAGIYLEEYTSQSRFANLLEINISNLAGIPSIIYGILGLEVFVRVMQFGESVLAGSMILALLILPIIVVATREALKAVPRTIREASYALGATRWETIWHQSLPAAASNIITGIILAVSRAVGETAPLIMIGALTYVPFVATSPFDEFTVLPIQIFNWTSRPQHEFTINAAAAILVLLAIVFVMNGIATYIRYRAQKKVIW